MGRPVGSREVTVEQVKKVVELSVSQERYSRGEIAQKSSMSKRAVWRYQKQFDLV